MTREAPELLKQLYPSIPQPPPADKKKKSHQLPCPAASSALVLPTNLLSHAACPAHLSTPLPCRTCHNAISHLASHGWRRMPGFPGRRPTQLKSGTACSRRRRCRCTASGLWHTHLPPACLDQTPASTLLLHLHLNQPHFLQASIATSYRKPIAAVQPRPSESACPGQH